MSRMSASGAAGQDPPGNPFFLHSTLLKFFHFWCSGLLSDSSLHCIIPLSFCLFLYGVCIDKLKLYVYDVRVSQKGSNGDRKLQFCGWDCVRYDGTMC